MNFFNEIIQFKLQKDMGIYNLTDEFFCVLLKAILEKEKKNILVVVDSLFEANKLYNNIINYDNRVFLFPMDDFLTSEAIAVSPELVINRLDTLNTVINKPSIIITNLMGYLRFLPKKSTFIIL